MKFDGDYKLSPQNSLRKGVYTRGYLEYEIATLPGVQAAIDEFTLEIAVRAEEDLAQHKMEWRAADAKDDSVPIDVLLSGHSFIEIENGDVDRFVVLNDERGQAAALSIEYGHAAYKVINKDGSSYVVGESQPTWILHNASNLPKRPKPRTKSRIVRRK